MKSQLLLLLIALVCSAKVAGAQGHELGERQRDIGTRLAPVQQLTPTADSLSPPNAATEPSQQLPVVNGRSGLHVVSPNAIQIGGGEGLRFGPPGMGVQYGGGQGVRYGTDNIGVKYGGGEGVRYGTRNIGVQYGGSQLLRWGTPTAGVRIGGGEGARIGTRNYGIQIGTGFGLQIGRIRSLGN